MSMFCIVVYVLTVSMFCVFFILFFLLGFSASATGSYQGGEMMMKLMMCSCLTVKNFNVLSSFSSFLESPSFVWLLCLYHV